MTPYQAMKLAIEEGKKGVGFVAPNPLVGCVILDRNHNLLSKGYHARVGEGHAEVNALQAIEDQKQLEGAHVFVTLEPCAHEGRTPSCAKTMAKLPLASVTYGLVDPNPKVAGQGAEILRASGKQVSLFTGLKTELEELCEIFLMNMRSSRPFVALKVACSIDGRIAMESGESQWITGETARAHVQSLRGAYDAILIGSGTFLIDDPRLNSRDPRFAAKPQRVILLDPDGVCAEKLENSKLLSVRPPENVLWVTNSTKSSIAQKIAMPKDLSSLLKNLYKEQGVTSILLEGGAGVYASFLKAKMVDRAYVYMAPKILGRGLSWSEGFVNRKLAEASQLVDSRFETLGQDILWSGKLAPNTVDEGAVTTQKPT